MIDQEKLLERTGSQIAKLLGEGPGRNDIETQRASLIASSDRDLRRKKRLRSLRLAAAMVMVAATAFLVASLLKSAPMRYWVGDEIDEVPTGTWFSSNSASPLKVSFSDGSKVLFVTGAHGRVLGASSQDVHLLLENGSLEADIKSAGKTRWVIDAGPFHVRVTGTEFTMQWNPNTTGLDVAVSRGSVIVDGLTSHAAGLTLVGGKRLSAAGQVVRIASLAPTGPAPTMTSPTQPAKAQNAESLDKSKPSSTSDRQPVSPARELRTKLAKITLEDTAPVEAPRTPSETWLQLYKSSKYREALNAAIEEGFDTLLGTLGIESLWALAESARYTQDVQRTRAALEALRNRFPESGQAKTAAFLIGRITLESDHWPAEGARWFRTYLREQPGGPLDEEASGRLIDALVKAGLTVEAREAAQAYLRRYPNGIFAEIARSAMKE